MISLPLANAVIAGENSDKVLSYFARHGASCPEDANPAEHIVETIQGNSEVEIDWVDVWSRSEERQRALEELETLNAKALEGSQGEEDTADFATSKWFQFRMVLHRLMVQLWRSPVRLSGQHFDGLREVSLNANAKFA